jgi:hypothetical protein
MTLTNLLIYDIGIPYQGNDGVLPSLKVFWNKAEYHFAFSFHRMTKKLIWSLWVRSLIHTCKTYIVKSNNGSRETSHTIKSRCACAWIQEIG